jgi:hypothetical protein
MKKFLTRIMFVLTCFVIISSGGCYGSFPLTNVIYKFNGEVSDNTIVQSLVMWLMIIIPVYDVAMIGDVLILNLIEFIEGKEVDLSFQERENGTMVSFIPSKSGSRAMLRINHADGECQSINFVKSSKNVFTIFDSDKNIAGYVTRQSENIYWLEDKDHNRVRKLDTSIIKTQS